VLEVGLGGRLDATNIVTPKVSVITSLSYDHTAVLGNTLALIAGEKAGIIKDGVPVVSSPQKDEALEVLERAATIKECEFTLVGKDVKFKKNSSSLDWQSISIAQSGAEQSRSAPVQLRIPLLGNHQIENAAVAYTALKTSGIVLSDEDIQNGFSQVKWRARFEIARQDPPVVIDSAHNRNSALRLRETLDEYYPGKPVVMLFCVLEDKDLSGMLEELKPRLDHVVATRADHPRAPTAESIAEQVKLAGISVEVMTPVSSALERALEVAGEQKLVLSAGSVAFAGEVIAAWQKSLTLPSPSGRGGSRPDKKTSQSG
jgi:dihydrofolate synthase/folylpolyglutamate synthase